MIKEDHSYLPLAAAYETFQTAILVHDDIIDNAELRRGKKTIHKIVRIAPKNIPNINQTEFQCLIKCKAKWI